MADYVTHGNKGTSVVSRESIRLETGMPMEEYVGERKPAGEITVKLNVDASEALTALKALQREARKAMRTLKGVEHADSIRIERVGDYAVTEIKRDLSAYSTKELTDELSRRTGVREIVLGVDNSASIAVYHGKEGYSEKITGPARILVNVD